MIFNLFGLRVSFDPRDRSDQLWGIVAGGCMAGLLVACMLFGGMDFLAKVLVGAR